MFGSCGRENSTIKIGNLEVMTKDIGNKVMVEWNSAMKHCEDLGDGWRLPTKEELIILYENKDKIGGFAITYYWSSTDFANVFAWIQGFSFGAQNNTVKAVTENVRAVRSI